MPTWRERLAGLPWRRIGLLSAGLFLVAMIVISAFELVSGRSVASYTGGSDDGGGTSISNVVGGGDQSGDRNQDDGPGAPGSEQPTPGQQPTGEEPTDQPGRSPSEDPGEAPTESTEPTESTPPSSPSPTPSAPATAATP